MSSRKWLLVRLTALAVVASGLAAWRYAVTRPDYRFARGLEAARGGRVDDALWYADRLEASDPPAAGLIRAEYEFAQKQPLAALRALLPFQGADAHPRRRDGLALSARCYQALGKTREAIASWRLLLRDRPDDVDAHRSLAVIAYDLGQLATALHHLREVGRLDPRDGKPARMAGTIHQDLGNHEAAAAAYREALGRDLPAAARAEAYTEFGDSLLKLRKYDEMLTMAEEAVAAGVPQTAGWLVGRAEALHGVGRAADAKAVLARALAADPEATPALYLRAQFHLDDGQPAEAVRLLEKADARPPRAYRVTFLLAQAYAQVGRRADADAMGKTAEALRRDLDRITELTREAEQRPWDADIRVELADLSTRMGYPDVAAMWRKAAAAVRPK